MKEQGPLTVEQEAELAELQPKAQQKQKKKEANAKRYQARKAAAARVVELEALAERGPLTGEQEAELAELQPKAQQKQKMKEGNAKRYWAGKAAVARVAELEALKEQGPLTGEQEAELAELQPKAQQKAQQKQRQKDYDAERHQAGKIAAARVVELEALKEQGPLTEEQEMELAGLRPKAQQWQKQKDENVERHRAGKAAADRVAVLEALAEQGPLTVEQEAELAELQPKAQQKAQQKQRQKESAAKYRRVGKAALDRVVELEGLEGLTEEQEVELAELQPKAQQWRQKKDWYRVGKAAADRVVELEGLEGLTEEQEAELAELRPKAQQWQKKKEENADWHRARKAAADRVVELEELEGLEGLTEEQEVELAELRPKVQQWQKMGRAAVDRVVELEGLEGLTEEQEAELAELRPKAEQWRKQKERMADWSRARKAAADRVVELEALKEQGPLTVEQEAELTELRPKAQLWRKQKERLADWYQARKADVDRAAVLEELARRGPLTEEQEVELAELRPKAQQWKKRKVSEADWRRARKAAVDRVAVLEELGRRGPLTDEQEAELAELQPKVAQLKQKEKEQNATYRREMKAEADRVAELEELEGLEGLTEEQEVELAELQSKAARRGRKKKDREVTETGVGGALVADRGAGPEGVSGWTGADQDDSDTWSADVDLGGWRAQAGGAVGSGVWGLQIR